MCYTTDNDPLKAEVRRMRKPKISLRTGLSTVIVLCWLAPILLLVVAFGALLEQSYKRSARQETDDTAQFALMQIQTELENAINDSKSVSYDGVIRSAYLNYRENGNKITLYRSVNGYLRDSFSRSDLYRAVFLVFWDEQINGVYAFGAGESGPVLIQDCRVAADKIVKIIGDEDTRTRFLLVGEELYLARNLLDSHFEPYASIVMMFKSSALLSPLSVLGSSEDIQLQLDGLSFVRSGEDGLIAEAERDGGYRYEATADGPGLPGGSRDGQIELFVIYC